MIAHEIIPTFASKQDVSPHSGAMPTWAASRLRQDLPVDQGRYIRLSTESDTHPPTRHWIESPDKDLLNRS